MSGLNKVMIIGNLGRDPEITYTPSGVAVCKISVATTESWNDKTTGEKREKTEWHRIIFFDKKAETIGKYMSKGSQIYVEGRIQTSQYEKDGITRYSTDIIANNFQFIGGKNEQVQQAPIQPNQNQAQPPGGFQQQQGFQQQAPQPQQTTGLKQQETFGSALNQQEQSSGYDDIPF